MQGEIKAKTADVQELSQRWAGAKQAEQVLEQKADDPEGSLTMGQYLCLDKGDWAKGLAYLALGSSAALRAPAITELEGVAEKRPGIPRRYLVGAFRESRRKAAARVAEACLFLVPESTGRVHRGSPRTK